MNCANCGDEIMRGRDAFEGGTCAACFLEARARRDHGNDAVDAIMSESHVDETLAPGEHVECEGGYIARTYGADPSYYAETVDPDTGTPGELSDRFATTGEARAWLAAREACAQCGVSYSSHPPGDGLTECPGDFGTITSAPREDDPS